MPLTYIHTCYTCSNVPTKNHLELFWAVFIVRLHNSCLTTWHNYCCGVHELVSPSYALCLFGASERLADHSPQESSHSSLVGHPQSSLVGWQFVAACCVHRMWPVLDASANETCPSLVLYLIT
jgi:hypothetical protein